MYDEFIFFTVFVQKNIRSMTLLDVEHKMRVQTNPVTNFKYLIFQELLLQPAAATNFVFISITKLIVFLTHIIVQVFLFGGWLSSIQTFNGAGNFHFMALMSPRAMEFSMKGGERDSSF